MTENERFGLVFTKTGSINSSTGLLLRLKNDYAFRGRGWGFSLLFSLLTQFAFIFFAAWNVSLPCEQSEKTHFFRFKARTKIPTFSLIFALKANMSGAP
jgi:hypothetical protein